MRDTLCVDELRSGEDWTELSANGPHIGLNATEATGAGAVIAFQPQTSLDEAVEQLRGEGVRIAGEISEHPWGRVATFKDPDGTDLQFYEPPSG